MDRRHGSEGLLRRGERGLDSEASWSEILCIHRSVAMLLDSGMTRLSQGEVQKSGGRSALDAATGSCHEICSCRPPLLPPPPPPPPPPRQLATPTVKPTDYPPLKPWWTDMVILIAVGCATLVFLVIAVIICYKAIKRKPMRKEENGTSRAEYAMTSQNDKMPDTNSAII
ncbi:proline-rich membrane anchor 1 isoform X4 [Scyliorhinus canicula]|uniref:proline-rich membrane anchor 1 isoform X4 n=1 Tax=Scyliorhinus canicula TaxID=7830 RepID=UPI0018F5915F|nr:proline-rich membrane anchor 1 isoform X4 [Scyliorhinus canicula]